MKLSARNQLKGIVKSVVPGAVNAVVTIEIPGGHTITSDITVQAVKELKLVEGKEVYAVIKASDVLVGVDH